jgi:hypothetical protein
MDPSGGATPPSKHFLAAFTIIGLVVGANAAACGYTAGWFSPNRLTPERMVAALSHRGGNPLGHRRNHAKRVCFTGTFEANGAGTSLSTALMIREELSRHLAVRHCDRRSRGSRRHR